MTCANSTFAGTILMHSEKRGKGNSGQLEKRISICWRFMRTQSGTSNRRIRNNSIGENYCCYDMYHISIALRVPVRSYVARLPCGSIFN